MTATVRSRLRSDLTAALKAGDRLAVAALRSALAAIDNAEAVDAGSLPQRATSSEHLAGASVVGCVLNGAAAASTPYLKSYER